MKDKTYLLQLVFTVLVLVGCGVVSASGTAECPAADADSVLYVSEANSYCLHYPKGYLVTEFEDHSIRIEREPQAFPHPLPPFAQITVSDAANRSAAEIADEILAELGDAFNVEHSSVVLGGVEAVVLDGMPGQDINRQVIGVRDDTLYTLFFVPAGEDYGDAYTQMESLYDEVISSFSFIS